MSLKIHRSETNSIPAQRRFHRDCLEAHNNYRRIHGVAPLSLNKELSAFAQEWAEVSCRETCKQREMAKFCGSLAANHVVALTCVAMQSCIIENIC